MTKVRKRKGKWPRHVVRSKAVVKTASAGSTEGEKKQGRKEIKVNRGIEVWKL